MKTWLKLTIALFIPIFLTSCSTGSSTGSIFRTSIATPTITSTPAPTMTLTLTATPIVSFPDEGVVKFRILHWNDFHGELVERAEGELWIPGAAYLSAFVKSERDETGTDQTLLLDAGDWIEGSRFANPSRGQVMLDFYNWLGVNAATIGNHEMFYGVGRLTEVLENPGNLKILSVNYQRVNDEGQCTTTHLSDGYEIFVLGEEGGPKVRVAVIGATGMDFQHMMAGIGPAKHVCFPDPVMKIEQVYHEIKNIEKADVIVLLTHQDHENDLKMAEQLNADGYPVDVIIGGHSHAWINEPDIIGNTVVVTAGERGRAVGEFDFTYDRASKSLEVSWKQEIFTKRSPQDPEVKTFLTLYEPTPQTGDDPEPTSIPPDKYLLDIQPKSADVGMWSLGVGVFPENQSDFEKGRQIATHQKIYGWGLFAHAPSRLVYELNGEYSLFKADILIEDSACGDGARFSVFLDGNKIYQSDVILPTDLPASIELDVTGGRLLELTTSIVQNMDCDWTIWGDPYLMR
jgi:hypothetical protein